MNSLVRVFSNFKEFYSEINGATLTGAIDVIVVEQPNGEFLCSPFHVRFGKLGVLRSREKIVDIEINGEPVDIHMKLGESGEAFFVEECPEEEVEELPANLATSPIPSSELINYEERKKCTPPEEEELTLPIPRRNSIDLLNEHNYDESENKFENQVSNFNYRRHTDNTLDRRNLSNSKKEYTTQKIRQEWAEHEDKILQLNSLEATSITVTPNEISNSNINNITVNGEISVDIEINKENEPQEVNYSNKMKQLNTTIDKIKSEQINLIKRENVPVIVNKTNDEINNTNNTKEDSKSKKKRRKRSQIKKKNSQQQQQQQQSQSQSQSQLQLQPLQQHKSLSFDSIVDTQQSDGGSFSGGTDFNNESESDSLSFLNNSIGLINNDELSLNINNDENLQKIDNKIEQVTVSSLLQQQPSSSKTTTSLLSASLSPVKDNNNKTVITDMINDKIDNVNDQYDNYNQSSPSSSNRLRDFDIHFFSDTEIATGLSPHCSRPSTPIQSDSELEISQCKDNHHLITTGNSTSWKWGELPQTTDEKKDGNQVQQQRNSMLSGMFSFMKKTNKMRKNGTTNEGGIYLSDLNTECMDPEMMALYFPPNNKSDTSLNMRLEEDIESGNGTSLPHSPSSMEGGSKSLDSDYDDGRTDKYLDFIAMSLCGGMQKEDGPSDEEFDRHIVKYSDVCKNPAIFSSPNLVVRLNGKYYGWTAACPIVMTIIIFQKPLSDDMIEQLMNVSKSVSLDTVNENDPITGNVKNNTNSNLNPISNPTPGSVQEPTKRAYSWWYWRRSAGADKRDSKDTEDKDADQIAVATQTSRSNTPDCSNDIKNKNVVTTVTANITTTSIHVTNKSSPTTNEFIMEENNYTNNAKEKYKKTLRLSSKSIKSLNLKPGMNEIEFSVTTAYQGTSRCKCYLFRWKHNDKVVISDIDGTITKSDVLGHILPMVGKDWAQIGVAQLFSKIEANGYKLLYLSARAIGQSRVTREYLRSIRQGDVKLPDGPLLLNPTSLISAFHREVIEKKPEQFKIACLTDIQTLFPENPFYAGYGNRINDVWAYRAVGIPIMRIFTINTKGELKHELTQTFQSSYCSMINIVDQLFPPINDDEGTIEYSNFNYWRDPVPELGLDTSELLSSSSSMNCGNNGGCGGGGVGSGSSNNNNNNIINHPAVVNGHNIVVSTIPHLTSASSKQLATIPEN